MSYRDIAKYYDQIFPFSEEKIEFLKKFLPRKKSILDIGCGTGKYTAELNKLDYDAIGFDVDGDMLKIAKKNFFETTFVQENIINLDKIGLHFDEAFCISHAFSYLTPEQKELFLKNLSQRLPEDGIWIVQNFNWDMVLKCDKLGFTDIYLNEINAENVLKFRRWLENITPKKVDLHRQILENRTPITHNILSLFPIKHTEIITLHNKYNLKLMHSFANFSEDKFDINNSENNILVFKKINT